MMQILKFHVFVLNKASEMYVFGRKSHDTYQSLVDHSSSSFPPTCSDHFLIYCWPKLSPHMTNWAAGGKCCIVSEIGDLYLWFCDILSFVVWVGLTRYGSINAGRHVCQSFSVAFFKRYAIWNNWIGLR